MANRRIKRQVDAVLNGGNCTPDPEWQKHYDHIMAEETYRFLGPGERCKGSKQCKHPAYNINGLCSLHGCLQASVEFEKKDSQWRKEKRICCA